MSQSRQNKGSAGQRYRPYASSAASSAANDKLRFGVPEDLKLVYLNVQDGTKAQPFQENLNAFSSYAGSNVEDGGSIREFILELCETTLESQRLQERTLMRPIAKFGKESAPNMYGQR